VAKGKINNNYSSFSMLLKVLQVDLKIYSSNVYPFENIFINAVSVVSNTYKEEQISKSIKDLGSRWGSFSNFTNSTACIGSIEYRRHYSVL
jgi:hypothetical protein